MYHNWDNITHIQFRMKTDYTDERKKSKYGLCLAMFSFSLIPFCFLTLIAIVPLIQDKNDVICIAVDYNALQH